MEGSDEAPLLILTFTLTLTSGHSRLQTTTNHTNRGFGGHETAPDDMGHDGTVL